MRPRSRPWVASGLVVLGVFAAATVDGTFAAFRGTTSNGPNAFATATCSNPGTQTVAPPDRDTYVNQGSPTTNYASDPVVRVESLTGSNDRSLLHFNMPAIPSGCSVSSAFLRLRTDTNVWVSGRTLQVFQISSSWTSTGVNWSNQPGTTGSAATAASTSGWMQWNVTSQVQGQYAGTNNGLLIRDSSESAGTAQSQEYSSQNGGHTPELIVTFRWAQCSNPTASSLLPDRDTYVNEAAPTTNYGTNPELHVESETGSNDRTYLHFALPSIPSNCALIKATLVLYDYTAAGGRTLLVGMCSGSWTETGLIWNNKPTCGTNDVGAASGTGFIDWDVLVSVQTQISGTNDGLRVKDSAEGAGTAVEQYFPSRQAASTSPRPQLTLLLG